MTTEEKLEGIIELVACVDGNTRLLYSKIEGLHLALAQCLTLLEMPETNPRRASFITELKQVVKEAGEQPNAIEAMAVPCQLLSSLGWGI